jgi:hypothetical protein
MLSSNSHNWAAIFIGCGSFRTTMSSSFLHML